MKLLLLLFFCVNLQAQPIEFIVAAAVGGPDDTITRKLISKLEEQSSLRFVMVNKPGAEHTIGYNYMNQSIQPSLMISNNTIVNNDLYKTSKPVFKLGTFTNIVFVSKASPIKDMKDLIELSQKKQINFSGQRASEPHSSSLPFYYFCVFGLRACDNCALPRILLVGYPT